MYICEIVQGMMNNKYKNGDIFQNDDMGDIYIFQDELVWCDDNTPYTIVLGDDSRWKKV